MGCELSINEQKRVVPVTKGALSLGKQRTTDSCMLRPRRLEKKARKTTPRIGWLAAAKERLSAAFDWTSLKRKV